MARSKLFLDDNKIKDLVRSWRNHEILVEDVISQLAEYIYSYPKVAHRIHLDDCTDYFIYVVERLPKKLEGYQEKKAKFATWFSVVLSNLYYDWIRTKKKSPVIEVNPNLEKYMENLPGQYDVEKELWKERHLGRIQPILSQLPPKIKAVMKLYYFDFFEAEDIYLIAKLFNRDVPHLFEQYEVLLKKFQKKLDKESALLDKITGYFHDIQQLEYQLKICNDGDKKMTMEEKLKMLQRRHRKAIKDYQEYYRTLTIKDIAHYIGLSIGTAYNLIYRGRYLLELHLQEYVA